MLIPKSFLHWIELAIHRQSFDSEHFTPVCLDGEHGAAFDRFAVHVYSAGAADGCLTSDVRAREADYVAQVMNQQQPRLYRVAPLLSVDRKLDVSSHGKYQRI